MGGANGVTLGVMIAFTTYSSMLSQMLSNISNFTSFLQPAMAAAGRIFELLEESEIVESTPLSNKFDISSCEGETFAQPSRLREGVDLSTEGSPSRLREGGSRSETEGSTPLSLRDISPLKGETSLLTEGLNVKGDVKFEHVKFGYVPDRIIIHDFSAVIKAGQKIAIVGPTGAGKTTIMNLLMKFYELNDGEIYFDGSVKDNIIYSSKNISDERLNEVLEISGLDYFVKALPEGFDTIINETSNLSVGQKQLTRNY